MVLPGPLLIRVIPKALLTPLPLHVPVGLAPISLFLPAIILPSLLILSLPLLSVRVLHLANALFLLTAAILLLPLPRLIRSALLVSILPVSILPIRGLLVLILPVAVLPILNLTVLGPLRLAILWLCRLTRQVPVLLPLSTLIGRDFFLRLLLLLVFVLLLGLLILCASWHGDPEDHE